MKRLLLLILIVLPLAANAGAVFLGSNTKIKRIRLYNGYAVVYTVDPIQKASCATVDNAFILTLEDSAFGSQKYATLLTAMNTNKVFNPWCAGDCQQIWSDQFTKCTEASIEQ